MALTSPYIAADGSSFTDLDAATQATYLTQNNGNYSLAAASFVQAQNQRLIQTGDAVQLQDGTILLLSNIKAQLLGASPPYTGPTDRNSLIAAYNMLHQPAPAAPVTNGTEPSGGVNQTHTPIAAGLLNTVEADISKITSNPLALGAAAVGAYFLFFRGHRR